MPAVVKKKKVARKQSSFFKSSSIIAVGVLVLSLALITNESQRNQDQRTRAQVTNCEVSAADMTIDAEEQKMFDQLNAYRQANGSPPLTLSTNLTRMASWLSRDMVTKDYLDHTDSLGRDPFRRAAECNSPYGAENIAYGHEDAEGTMTQWKDSPGHSTNMLDPKYTVVGIARAGDHWTQDFAVEDTGGADPEATTLPSLPPTTTVPNPGCLGSCPTPVPSVDPTEPQPSIEIPITDTPEEPEITDMPEPTIPLPEGGNPDPGTGGGGNDGGIIGLFLGFLKLLLELFLSMFK